MTNIDAQLVRAVARKLMTTAKNVDKHNFVRVVRCIKVNVNNSFSRVRIEISELINILKAGDGDRYWLRYAGATGIIDSYQISTRYRWPKCFSGCPFAFLISYF